MELDIFQVDSFTDKVFCGNPAAVVPLPEWLPDDILQKIASENNLSETAFFTPTNSGYHLRWFTPTIEVDLCGHATLAAAAVIFEKLSYDKTSINFISKSGILTVSKNIKGYTLDFPIWDYKKEKIKEDIVEALGAKPEEIYSGIDWVAEFKSEADIASLSPNMTKLAALNYMRGIITTAKGTNGIDFVSRWFGPQVGVAEDPVTGSAHCLLAPFWAERLGKTTLNARQISSRGGDIYCELRGDRVHLTGKAEFYLQGKIKI